MLEIVDALVAREQAAETARAPQGDGVEAVAQQ
jgi:hypothetical protein